MLHRLWNFLLWSPVWLRDYRNPCVADHMLGFRKKKQYDRIKLPSTMCSDADTDLPNNFPYVICSPIGSPNVALPWYHKYFERDWQCAMIVDRKLRRPPFVASGTLQHFIPKIYSMYCCKSLKMIPRFDAWKLSCGDIISTWAVSLERGKIDLSEFILSTA